MNARSLLLAAAIGLLILGQESRGQMPGYGYPMLPGYGAVQAYPYPPGYVAPAGYMQPNGATMVPPAAGPTAAMPAPAGAQAAACPSSAARGAESACDDPCCGSCVDCTCRVCGWQFYSEYMLLRASNAEVPFAVPIDGGIFPPPAQPVERGPVGLLNPEYSSAYRIGFARALDCASSLGASYSRFESQTTAAITAEPTFAIRSLVIHPSTLNAAGDFQAASGVFDLDYQLADITYRCTFAGNDRWTLDYILGVAYGHLEQFMATDFTFIGTQHVNTGVTFDGGGPKVGCILERYAKDNGFMVYGRGLARFLAGQFSADYLQTDAFGGTLVNTSWRANRIVPIMELEVGGGWVSPGGMLRVTAGYMVSGWYNVVKTSDFIEGVQRDNFNHLSNTIGFDGLVARLETRF